MYSSFSLPSSPATTTALSDSSAVAIPTTTNTAYEMTKLEEKVGIGVVDEPPKSLSPPAHPVTTPGAKGQDMYEDASPPVIPQKYENVSLSGEQ